MQILCKDMSIGNIIDANQMVLILFGHKNCGVCTVLKTRLNEMLSLYPKIKSIYVDISKFPKIATTHDFYTVPGIILFINKKETIREAGIINLRDLENNIGRYYSLLF